MKTTSHILFTLIALTAFGVCSTPVVNAQQDYSNTHIKNSTGKPLGLINYHDQQGNIAAVLYISGTEATFGQNQILIKGEAYIQAETNKSISIVATATPSAGHDEDFYPGQFMFEANRIEFDEQGKVALVLGLKPKMIRFLQSEMTITSTEKLVATNGLVQLSFDGGHTLLLSIDSTCHGRIDNADFFLFKKQK